MTPVHFMTALRAFTHRRSFRPFLIDFMSGDRVLAVQRYAELTKGS